MAALLQALSGVVAGYLVISLSECFFHRVLQHAAPGLRRRTRSLGRLGRALHRAWYAHHVVHHSLTFRRDHVTQFRSEDEQRLLDAHLVRRDRTDIIASRYGAIIGPRVMDFIDYMIPTLPGFLGICLLGGGWFTLGALIPLIAWPLLAQLVHPTLHLPTEHAARDVPRYLRAITRTAYFRYLARHHWLHHRYGDCNYNLLLGGDLILRTHRTASREDLEAMREIGLWAPDGRTWRPGAPINHS